jgi:hypothetical protein
VVKEVGQLVDQRRAEELKARRPGRAVSSKRRWPASRRCVPIHFDPSIDVTDARSRPCQLTANYASGPPASIVREGPGGPASCLLPEPHEPVRQLRSPFPLVGELRDE